MLPKNKKSSDPFEKEASASRGDSTIGSPRLIKRSIKQNRKSYVHFFLSLEAANITFHFCFSNSLNTSCSVNMRNGNKSFV